MTMAPSATAISRASIGTSTCSEAYLRRNATPKNNTITPKRTSALPPKKKFHSADGCAEGMAGLSPGSGPAGATKSSAVSKGSCAGELVVEEKTMSGSEEISTDGGSDAVRTISSDDGARPSGTGVDCDDEASNWDFSNAETRCRRYSTEASSSPNRSSLADFCLADSVQPTPAPAMAPIKAPGTTPIAPIKPPTIKPINHITKHQTPATVTQLR